MSSAMFNNDPLTWWDDKPAQTAEANIAITLDERSTDGFSFYDWINFSDYYGTLIFHVCNLIVDNTIKPADGSNSLIAPATHLLQLINQVNIWAQQSDNLKIHEIDNHIRLNSAIGKTQRNIVSLFFTQILPKLPFVDDYIIPIADRRFLLNPVDYPTAGSFLMRTLKDGVAKFVTGHGYPDIYTMEGWVEILEFIVANLNTNTGVIPTPALNLLVGNFLSLWD